MSPWHTCKKCNLFVIGEEKYGCFICIKKEVCNKIKIMKYSNALLGCKLPIDIILYISLLASNNYDDSKLLSNLELCWKSRMHNTIK